MNHQLDTAQHAQSASADLDWLAQLRDLNHLSVLCGGLSGLADSVTITDRILDGRFTMITRPESVSCIWQDPMVILIDR
jgi:hypothetical protein